MTATATPTAPKRARKPKVQRTLTHEILADGLVALTITDADGKTRYAAIREANADEFEVRKFAEDCIDGEPSVYRVCITAGEESCNCRGFSFCAARGTVCRHVAALKVLRIRKSI